MTEGWRSPPEPEPVSLEIHPEELNALDYTQENIFEPNLAQKHIPQGRSVLSRNQRQIGLP